MEEKKKCLTSLGLLIAFCLSSVCLSAADYHFRQLTSDEKLSQNFVDDIYKDSKGFMWFATWGGLDRYDGYSVISYNTENAKLKSNFCYCLAEDSHERLWVGSDLGLSCIDLNTGRSLNLIEENAQYRNALSQTVYDLHCDSQSKLWVAGDHGLVCLVFDEQGGIVNLYSLNMLTVFALCEDYDGRIWLATSSGKLLCLSNKNPGQFDFEIVPELLRRETFDFIRSIYSDRTGSLWVASSQGLFRYDPHADILQGYQHSETKSGSLPNNFVNDVLQDNTGNIWVATLGGLALWNQETGNFTRFQSDDTDESINNNFLNSLFVDDRNILWIGTEKGGVNWMFEKRKAIHGLRHDPANPGSIYPGPVNSILEDSRGNLWVGLVEGGLHFRARGQDSFRHYLHNNKPGSLTQNTVSKIYEDSESTIWVGTWGGGLNRLRADGSGFKSYVPGDEKGSIASLFISDLVEDSLHNGLWVGMNNGLQFLSKQSGQFLNVFVGSDIPYPPKQVNFLKIDRRQRLWVATNFGLYCFYLHSFDIPGTPAKYDYFRFSLHDPSSGQLAKVISIYEDEDEDILWFGTNGDGLYKMEEISGADSADLKKKTGWEGQGVYKVAESYVRFVRYDKRHGFADNVIYTILEDDNDCLWMSTNNGLVRFEPQNTEVVNYSKEDGLLSNQFYWMAACKGHDGTLYFGNLQGLNYIEPGRFKNNDHMPKPSLTALQILNNTIEPGVAVNNKVYLEKHLYASSELVIPKKDKSFSLEFSALDYEFPECIRYSYYLEGFDKQWTDVGPERRFVYYTNLKQGKYLFKLRCTNSDGVWSDKITSLPVVISPPFHQSLMFRLVLILVLLGLASFAFISREKKIKQNRAELETKVKARTKELQEAYRQVEALNQEKLSVFTNITHEFKTPLSLIMGPIKKILNLSKDPLVLDQLKLAERNAENLLVLVNQLMDFRKVEEKASKLQKTRGNLLDLVREVLLPFADAVERNFVQCSLISRLKNPELIFDAEILRKILSNLLSNAVKHTPDYGSIKIKLFDIQKDNADWIRITVSDSGKGIPEEESEKIFERFYRIEDQETFRAAGQSGTGVGLFLCRELAQLHGGIIYAGNNRLGGARFVLEIPAEFPTSPVENLVKTENAVGDNVLDREEAEEGRLRGNSSSAAAATPSKPLLLIVEDNKDMRQYLASVLREQYNLLEAADGEEGWTMVQRNLPDVVISDVMMPRMDGIQLCRKIKTEFKTSHIPVILLTAFSSPNNEIEGLESGANDYLSKPFEERLLKAKIKNILQLRERIHQSFAENMSTGQLEIAENSPDKYLLEKMMKIVQLRYSDPLFNVSVFIEELGISRSLLHKKLQSLVGQSAGRFIRNYRLNKAKEIISIYPGMNISEVAYSVGFNDPKYFTRCFTKRYGMAPSVYSLNLHES